jgi:hypothetical protein
LSWRRLDSIERVTATMHADPKQFYGDSRKIEGRIDELSERVR